MARPPFMLHEIEKAFHINATIQTIPAKVTTAPTARPIQESPAS